MIGFNGGLVGSTRTPSTSSASGVWTSNEQANAQRTGTWPLGPVDYVTSGLQLYLDAGKTSSYSGTGNAWNDISGNSRNATLSNFTFDGTDGGGSIVFNGTSSAAQVTGSITSVTSVTFLVFIKVSASMTNYNGIIFNRSSHATGIHAQNTTLNLDWNGTTRTHNTSMPTNEWIMVAAAFASNSVDFYQYRASAQTSSTTGLTSSASLTLDDIDIGQDDLGGRFFNGKIGIAMVYNRALTSTEITQNWNAFKLRFGIS